MEATEHIKEDMTMANTDQLILTDATFISETSEGVVLVDFWAPWCGPCIRQGPIIEKVAAAMAGLATVGKCDVDKASETPARFGIKGIPTLVILKDGKEVERFSGLQQEATLIEALKRHAARE
jgi:thioredoxin 1